MRLIHKEARSTFMLAMPITFGSVSMILMGALDSLMIGHVGTVPLAASAFTNSIFGFVYIVSIGLVMPTSVLVSRSHGAANKEDCVEWLQLGMRVSLTTGLCGALLMGLTSLRLQLFDQPPDVIRETLPFFLLFGISLVPVMVFQALRQYAEALNYPWIPMAILFATVTLNAGLNWILIYGNWGSPAFGLVGAGLATLLSRIVCVIAIVLWLRHKLLPMGLWPRGGTLRKRWFKPFERVRVREFFGLGIPAATQLFFEVCSFSFAGIMMGWLGAKALASHQIAMSCASLTFMVPLGLSIATGMRLSHALGAGNRASLRNIGMGAFLMTWAAMGCFAIILLLCGTWISTWFSRDGEVIGIASQLIIVVAFFQIFDGTQVVGSGSLRGLSDVKIPTLITGIAYSGIAIPTCYLLGVRGIGPTGVWIGLAAGLAVAATALFWRFLRQTRA